MHDDYVLVKYNRYITFYAILRSEYYRMHRYSDNGEIIATGTVKQLSALRKLLENRE